MATVKDIGPNRYDLTESGTYVSSEVRPVTKGSDSGFMPDESNPPTADSSGAFDFIHQVGNFAVCLWVCPPPQANTQFFDNSRTNLTYSYTNETVAANMAGLGTTDLLSSNGSAPIGKPCFIVWTADTSNHYLYVNGVLEDSDTFNTDAAAGIEPEWCDWNDLSAGEAGPVLGEAFVVHRRLTEDEILDLYAKGRRDYVLQDLGDNKLRASTFAPINDTTIFEGASIAPGAPIRYTNSITTNGENSEAPTNATGDWDDVNDPIDDPGSDEIAPTSSSSAMTYYFDWETADPVPYKDGSDNATLQILVRTNTGSAGIGDPTVQAWAYHTMVSGGSLGEIGDVSVPSQQSSYLVEMPWDPYGGSPSLDRDLGNLIIRINTNPGFAGSDCPAILAVQLKYDHSPDDQTNVVIPEMRAFTGAWTIIMEMELTEWIDDTDARTFLSIYDSGSPEVSIYTRAGTTGSVYELGLGSDPSAGTGTTPKMYPGKYLLVVSGDTDYDGDTEGHIYLNGVLIDDIGATNWPNLPATSVASIGSRVGGGLDRSEIKVGNVAFLERRIGPAEVYDLWLELTNKPRWSRELPDTITSAFKPNTLSSAGVAIESFDWDWAEATETELALGFARNTGDPSANASVSGVTPNSADIPYVGSNRSLYIDGGSIHDLFNGDAFVSGIDWYLRTAVLMDDQNNGPWESSPTGDVSSSNTSSSYTDVDDPVDSPPGNWGGTPTTSGSNWEMVLSFPDEVAGRKYARGDDRLELRVYCRKAGIGGGTGTLNAWVQDGAALNRQIITSGSVTSDSGEILTGTFSWDELDNGAGYDNLRIRVQGIGGATYLEIDALEVRQPDYAELFVLGLYPEDTFAVGQGSDGWVESRLLDVSDDSPDQSTSVTGVDIHDGLVHGVLICHDGRTDVARVFVDGVQMASFSSTPLAGTTWANGGIAYPESGTDITHTNHTTYDTIYQGSDGFYASMGAAVGTGSSEFTDEDLEIISLPRIIGGDPRFDYASIFYDFSDASGGLTNVMGGLDATESGTPVYQQDPPLVNGIHEDVNYSVELDGSGEGFTIPFRRSDFLFENNHTISMYFKFSDTPPTNPALFSADFVGTGYYALFESGGNLVLRLNDGASEDLTSSGIDVTDGAWHRVTVRVNWDDDETRMWLDGVFQGIDDISGFTPDEFVDFKIGDQDVGLADFEGNIGAFTMFIGPMDARLSDADRAEL